MEDITIYGEITASHHKGETTGAVLGIGFLMAVAALFFVGSGLYHVVSALTPYWQRVSVGEAAQTKGAFNFVCFAGLALGRVALGLFLGLVALEVWDGRNVARKWMLLVVLPVAAWFWAALLDLAPPLSGHLFTLGYLSGSRASAAFIAALVAMTAAAVLALILSSSFRVATDETSWGLAVGMAVVGFMVVGGAAAQLDDDERVTALLGNMAPFTDSASGLSLLVLENISPAYLTCMDNLVAAEAACKSRSKTLQIRYENFTGRQRAEGLLEQLVGYGLLPEVPVCPDGGWYRVELDGSWACSEHGSYDAARVARGRELQQLLESGAGSEDGADAEGGS